VLHWRTTIPCTTHWRNHRKCISRHE
jgi:hypothetical protein